MGKTIEEIENIRKEKREELDLRVNANSSTKEKHILVCHGTGCTSSKSPEILENFRRIIEEKHIENVRVIMTGCFGLCSKGPIVIIRPEDTFYSMVKPEDCEEIINTHILGGKIVERLLLDGRSNKYILEQILSRVHGIDLSPLSVLTARVSFLLAIRPFIDDNNITEYSDLLYEFRVNDLVNMLNVAKNHTILFNTYIRSRRHKIEILKKEL